jgi:hypothetical protein
VNTVQVVAHVFMKQPEKMAFVPSNDMAVWLN